MLAGFFGRWSGTGCDA